MGAAGYKPYPAYKPSGVEWLGDIPEGWEAKRLGNLFEERREKVSDKDYPPLSVTMQGIVPQLETAAKSLDSDNRKLVKAGDFVINSRSDRKGSAGLSELDGSVTLISNVLKPRDIEGSFAHHLLKSYPFQEEYYRFGKGIVADLWSTNFNSMKNITLPVVPKEEQTKIAAFLDYETAKIDALIAKQERLIALLEEKRQAVISHAVTKGLDPTAPMRPSGIDWLGDVPAHWEVKSLKLIVSTRKGVAFKADDFCEDGVRVAKASDIKRLSLELSEVFLPRRYTETYPKAVLAEGNIVLSTVGSNPIVRNSAVGQVGRVPKSQSGSLLNQNTVVFDVDKEAVEENYVFAALLTRGYRDHLDLKAHGTANQSSLNVADMLDFFIPLPPATEHFEIAKHLQKNAKLFDDLGASSDAAITLLKERRTALISAAVTGKIDVRDWQAPEAISTQDISQDA